MASHWLREIENFFRTYKTLEGHETEITGWEGRDAAWQDFEAAILAWRAGLDVMEAELSGSAGWQGSRSTSW